MTIHSLAPCCVDNSLDMAISVSFHCCVVSHTYAFPVASKTTDLTKGLLRKLVGGIRNLQLVWFLGANAWGVLLLSKYLIGILSQTQVQEILSKVGQGKLVAGEAILLSYRSTGLPLLPVFSVFL